ncbi:MAG: hydroxymethylbilane synthase [Burkholderiales bacterium]|nr:hydroxymethylbilane synthase [Burkholderiales bacterium]
MWQAEQVRTRLAALYPGAAIGVLGVPGPPEGKSDAGDRAAMLRDLEAAMADGRADLAVHPLKNMPAVLPPGFTIAGITAREDPRDAFVSRKYASLAELPAGSAVGTSSVRRKAQLRERYPALAIRPMRGDVDARLRFLDSGRCDALIVAAAALKRSGHASRIASLLAADESLPAPGQGALAIECRSDRAELLAALAPLADRATTLATTAERAFSQMLCGTGTAPVAAYAAWEEGALWLRGLLADTGGRELMRGERDAQVDDAESATALGRKLADDFLARGASRLLTS